MRNLFGEPTIDSYIDQVGGLIVGMTVQKPAGTDEVQTVTIGGSPTGGTFTLTFIGQTTSAIAYNASAATVQTALQALSTIGTGNATVAGSAGGPYTVTFAGLLAGRNVPQMTGNGAGLTPSGTVTIATTTEGVTFTGYAIAPTGAGVKALGIVKALERIASLAGDHVSVVVYGPAVAIAGGSVSAGDRLKIGGTNGRLIATTTDNNEVIADSFDDGTDGVEIGVFVQKHRY